MSAQSLAGLVALNVLFLASGLAVLWLVRGWEIWSDVARLAGLTYLVGVVVLGSLWTMLLIVGVPFSLGLVLGTFGIVIAVASLAARRRGRTVPARPHARSARTAARHGFRHLRFRARAGGLLSRRAPVRSVLVGRLGVLGAEGEGDLLLREHRPRALQGASRLVLSAARPRARCGRVQAHGKSRRRDAPRPVLALRCRVRLGARRASRRARSRLDPLAVRAPRPRRAANRDAFLHHRGGSLSRLPLRAGVRSPLHLAARSRQVEARDRSRPDLRGCAHEARRHAARRAPAVHDVCSDS